MNKGIDFEARNARGHTALELATDPETKKFITNALNTRKCEACGSAFSFRNVRFFCNSGRRFYCKQCSIVTMEYHTWQSEQKERLVCRSLEVHKMIKEHEKLLEEAIASNDFHVLSKVLSKCLNMDIDAKLRK